MVSTFERERPRATPLPRGLLQFECLSGSLVPFQLAVRDDAGGPRWQVRERPRGGLLRYTKFRALLGLELELTGPSGAWVFRRNPGLFRTPCQLHGPDGRLRFVFVFEMFGGWDIRDPLGRRFARVRFSNPTILGTDRGELRAAGGALAAEILLRTASPLTSRRDGEIRLFAPEEPWEPVTVALAAARVASKQHR